MAKKNEDIEVTESSGNVFADLGLKNPAGLKTKATIAALINSLLKEQKMSQEKAADSLGITQPQVSDLKRGKLSHFSIERLFGFLNALNQNVEIVIKPNLSSDDASVDVNAA